MISQVLTVNKGEEITSRKFKDLVVFTVMGIAERVSAGLTSGGKQKYATNVIDLENWKNSGTSPSPSGGESQGGSQGGNGGSQNDNGGDGGDGGDDLDQG